MYYALQCNVLRLTVQCTTALQCNVLRLTVQYTTQSSINVTLLLPQVGQTAKIFNRAIVTKCEYCCF
jgi:hypothetical protein